MNAAIEIKGLVKRYGDLVAVDGLDLAVQAGECFGLLGPNGAGKTTAVEVMEGLRPPNSGTVQLLGQRWGRRDHLLRRRLGIALQETPFVDRLTVLETVRLFRSFYPEGREPEEILPAPAPRAGLPLRPRARRGPGGPAGRWTTCCSARRGARIPCPRRTARSPHPGAGTSTS
ncbi:MAG: ATP-binding cassette domain-containing protein [Pseudomonadota bacterium]